MLPLPLETIVQSLPQGSYRSEGEYWTALDSLYFCVVTLTTVGYGDLFPTTDGMKIFMIFYILFGLVVVGAIISEFAKFTISSSVAGLVDTDGDTVRTAWARWGSDPGVLHFGSGVGF